MLYDSLLLNCGGGIISDSIKARQYDGSATLAIGIGGTGIAALSMLKGKIHQQLLADDPDSPTPQYKGIQLLAIDSDESEYRKYRGNCRFGPDEFCSIHYPHIAQLLRAKAPIPTDPFMNWMDIDGINHVLSSNGAGGVRQVGRYLLISHIDKLKEMIESKCGTALRSANARSLDIHVFAGLSGGTGSGCFLDTCHLIRKIVDGNGWNAKIMGYFFLPDVVTSQPALAVDWSARNRNEANGYAALKELDYLMCLEENHDWFTQSYSPGLMVRTQEPPVDICHLVSARKSDGTLVCDGFSYSLNVATDHVMCHLTKSEGSDSTSYNTYSYLFPPLNPWTSFVTMPKINNGANISYCIMGACNAETPTNQINTYLACGFYAKFMAAVGNERAQVSKSHVKDLSEKLRLTADLVKRSVNDRMPPLELIDVDRNLLAKSAMPAPGELNSEWAKGGNDWLDKCVGVMDSNIKALTAPLSGFEKNKINTDSLIGRVFQKLWDIALDPNFGPYYAAKLLKNNAYDLPADVTGSITTTDERVTTHRMYLDGARKRLEEAKSTFYRKSSRGNYADYMQAATEFYGCGYQVMLHEKTAVALRKFYEMLQELYTKFFKPLTDMLDNLRDTFQENRYHLNADSSADPYTHQIITLAELEPTLKKRVEELSEKDLVTDFVGHLLNKSEAWSTGDGDGIAMLIRKFMLNLFKEESERCLQDYLVQKYPDAKDSKQLVDEIERDILDRIHVAATPMFWCDPIFNLDNTFTRNGLSVPASSPIICDAADRFKDYRPFDRYAIRQSIIGDRIFALRLSIGVPLYAYQGISLLKSAYDQAKDTPSAAGRHLYAKTGRGTDGSGEKDWLHFLPEPIPYSRLADTSPESEELRKLYDLAWEKGILAVNENGQYVLQLTEPIRFREYTPEDFTVDGVYDRKVYQAEFDRLYAQLEAPFAPCETIPLRGNGDREDVVARCRLDYFMAAPILQQLVREELEKPAVLEKILEGLKNFQYLNNATPPQVPDPAPVHVVPPIPQAPAPVPVQVIPPIPQAPAMVPMQTSKGLLWIVGNDPTRGWNGTAWIDL